MIGEGLAESLTYFTFKEGMFPMPSSVAESETAICAATPAYFCSDEGNVNIYNALNKNFLVNIENDAVWTVDNETITIENGIATLNAPGECVMTVSVGESSKYYNLTVVQIDPDNVTENIISNSIYPNPANNYLIIEDNDVKNVSIFNVNGQCILDVNISDNSRIDVSNLVPGMYILKAKHNDNSETNHNISIAR